jgi:cell division protein FtsN
MKVEGQGGTTFTTAEGGEANGKLDPNAKPETPISGTKVAPAPVIAAASKTVVSAAVPAGAPTLSAPAVPVAGGTMVQLGAYGSASTANEAWTSLASAHPMLARLSKVVVPAVVGNSTFYRLRANAGTPANASAICAQVGNCMVVK